MVFGAFYLTGNLLLNMCFICLFLMIWDALGFLLTILFYAFSFLWFFFAYFSFFLPYMRLIKFSLLPLFPNNLENIFRISILNRYNWLEVTQHHYHPSYRSAFFPTSFTEIQYTVNCLSSCLEYRYLTSVLNDSFVE